MGTLFVVATPIGNLEDITFRALRVLKEADVIVCEDTRHTLKLLSHFEIKKQLVSYHQHSKVQKIDQLIELLRSGKRGKNARHHIGKIFPVDRREKSAGSQNFSLPENQRYPLCRNSRGRSSSEIPGHS